MRGILSDLIISNELIRMSMMLEQKIDQLINAIDKISSVESSVWDEYVPNILSIVIGAMLTLLTTWIYENIKGKKDDKKKKENYFKVIENMMSILHIMDVKNRSFVGIREGHQAELSFYEDTELVDDKLTIVQQILTELIGISVRESYNTYFLMEAKGKVRLAQDKLRSMNETNSLSENGLNEVDTIIIDAISELQDYLNKEFIPLGTKK